MTTREAISLDQIRAYLGGLTPQARTSLLVEIERMQLYGEEVPGADLMLAELRAEFRKSGMSSDRAGNPSRHFFKPMEGLFVDRPPELTNCGQISRGSLSPIWEWVSQILLPAMASDYCEQMRRVIVTNDTHEAKRIAGAFQSKVLKYLEATLGSHQGVEGVRAGLGKFTCSRASFDDLEKIVSALRARDGMTAFNEALPPRIEILESEALAKVRSLLDGFVAKHPEALPFGLTLVAKRLKTPWQLVHLATGTVRRKYASDIAATRYGLSVPMVIDHLDDRRVALRQAIRSNRVAIARDILVDIYDIEGALKARIVRLEQTDWGQRFGELMTAVANDLQKEIETLPADVQHVLGSLRLRRNHSAPGLLTNLVRKSRDALVARGIL